MAQQVIVSLLDDVDGTEAAETVTFALDGQAYEIDLSEKNAAKVRKALEPFISKARKVKGPQGRRGSASRVSTAGSGSKGGSDAAAIRVWAAEQGITVGDKGRVPQSIREQYEAATGAAAGAA